MPMAVYTFLESYDFSGKTIVPFCTHEGSRLSSTENSIAGICPDAEMLEGWRSEVLWHRTLRTKQRKWW